MSAPETPSRFRRALVPIQRMGGFSASILLSSVIGIFTIPILVLALDDEGWASIGVLQTTGQLAAVFVAFGWGATGPSIVASLSPDQRVGFYRSSFRIRGILYLATVPVVTVLLALLLRGDLLLAVLGALAYVLPALGAGWYFTGIARPGAFFVLEALPSALGTVAGVWMAAVTRQAWVVPFGQLAGTGLAVALSYFFIVRRGRTPHAEAPPLRFWQTLAEQRHAVTTAVTSAVYVAMPVLLLTTFFPQGLPVYLIADRFFRYAVLAFLPIQQFFQGWVPADPTQVDRRARIAFLAGSVIGAVGGICVALLTPVVSPFFHIDVPLEVSVPLGFAFFGVALSAVVGYACLVVLGRTDFLATSTVVGAVVGIPAVAVAALLHSLPGVASAVAATELIVAGVQIVVLLRTLRQRRLRSDETTR
ncbi:hypothetical protein M4D51_06175 [Microbacterium sp. p3-SID338]|uniref:hypothetical protein n=1 Tax=unclassified Microbacterium TaxID=2609290 RepID=UPI0011AF95DF|nr:MULTISPECIES: hypothetical protein [unclassified Microbacterium]MCT1395309.1 hypothetical protein [Microbacterium sp. p3-SID338]